MDEQSLEQQTGTLPREQQEAIKKRVDTLNATLRKKQRQRPQRDVRTVFSSPPSTEVNRKLGSIYVSIQLSSNPYNMYKYMVKVRY